MHFRHSTICFMFCFTLAWLSSIPLAIAESTPARLIGTLWWLSPTEAQWPIEKWRTEFDALQGLGMNTLILTGGICGDVLKPDQTDPLEAFFTEADHHGLTCYLDTLQAPNWWTLTDPAPEIERAKGRIQLLKDRYGHHSSFKGWYVPYELYVFWGEKADLIRRIYTEVAVACKTTDSSRPVVISPFFILDKAGKLGDFRWATPAEYQAFWTDILRHAPIDIVALQDSGEHLSCYTLEDRRPFFRAMKAACDATGKIFWANIETGELAVDSVEEYVTRFGLKTHVNDPKTASAWRGVPADKLDQKLRMAGEFTTTAITWGYPEFIRPEKNPEAKKLYDAYRTLLKPQK